MNFNSNKLNAFIMIKLPSAYLCGVRVKHLNDSKCAVGVRHKWINQNPFKSMFWAVQGMAAELSTGALIMAKIKESGRKVSMLVTTNNATFTKKARGRITFTCNEGYLIDETLKKAVETGKGQTIWLKSIGLNKDGVVVSTFNFQWSLKVKA